MARSGATGITESALWSAWREVRRQLKRAPRRDVLDYLEYDIDPNVWITRLLRRLEAEDYSPERPQRFTVAKSKGFDRVITLPSIPDLVLYRTIVDYLFRRAKRQQVKHAYFCQATLSKVVDSAEKAALKKIAEEKLKDSDEYSSGFESVFLEWLKYDQYRKLLIFDRVYPYIVVTDITNFFDSVLYGRIEESLYGLPAPARMISLLFLLLESLSLREAFTPVQRIGLPVDPCDCSRVLAHMMLFPHDRRIVDMVGEDAYVRWMDDQNVGVRTKAEGLKVLGAVCDSLRKLHLTPNSSKSKILSLAEAKKHFHFIANGLLDSIEKLPHGTAKERVALRKAITSAWKIAVKSEGDGEWQKVLKRFYRQAARAGSRLLVKRAVIDVKQIPALVDRVVDYIRYVSDPDEVIDFVEALLHDPEQVYADVNYQLVESLLKLSPEPMTAKRLQKMSTQIFDQTIRFPGDADARALAPLIILRYGDGRNLRSLFTKLQRHADGLPQNTTRALCAVVGGCKKAGFDVVQDTASRLLRNHLSEFVKLVIRIREFDSVPGRFKTRVALSKDSITGADYVDMRAVLSARILGLCTHKTVNDWLADTKTKIKASGISPFEVALIERLWPKPNHGK